MCEINYLGWRQRLLTSRESILSGIHLYRLSHQQSHELDRGAHCNTFQHTATHCNTLQHTATLCNQSPIRSRRRSASKIWISRSTRFAGRSFESRGLRVLTRNLVWNFGDSHVNEFDMYGDSSENLLEILAVMKKLKSDLLRRWHRFTACSTTLWCRTPTLSVQTCVWKIQIYQHSYIQIYENMDIWTFT